MCRFVLKRLFIICKYIQLYRYITIEKFGDSTCRCVLKSILYNLTSLLGFVIYCNRIKKYKVVVKSIHLRACHVISHRCSDIFPIHIKAPTVLLWFTLFRVSHRIRFGSLLARTHACLVWHPLMETACLVCARTKPRTIWPRFWLHTQHGQKMHGSWACDGGISSFYHRNGSLKVSQI